MLRNIYKFSNKRAYILYTPLLVLIIACGKKEVNPTIEDPENTPTMISVNRTVVYSGNGHKRFRMFTPEVKVFELAKEPYMLYPKGLKVQTFKDTTIEIIESDLVADSARYYTQLELWEAYGNVVGNNYSSDKSFKTQRLFWDEKKGKIYSDTITWVRDGKSVTRGRNFETNQDFEVWTFNNASGQLAIPQNDTTSQMSDVQPVDSLTQAQK